MSDLFRGYNKELELKIEKLLSEAFEAEKFTPGFERVQKSFEVFHDSFSQSKIITIAGTNGKGETAYTLGEILKSYGHTYTLWSSPHILSLRERFSCDEGEISYSELSDLLEAFFNNEKSKNLSYYESLFYIFCQWSQLRNPEFIILEVGLGGRFDAVNVFEPELTSIVSISKDHQEILGDSLEKILFEKFGISRKGVELISSLEGEFLRGCLKKFATSKEVPLQDIFDLGLVSRDEDYSSRNKALAIELAKKVLSKNTKSEEMTRIVSEILPFKGRGEIVTRQDKRFIFIGAHNRDGIKKLCSRLNQENQSFNRTLIGFSQRSDDDILTCLKTLKAYPCVSRDIRITDFNHPRALDFNSYNRLLRGSDFKNSTVSVGDNITKELDSIFKDDSESILVTGSYYFIGEFQKTLDLLC